MIAKSLTPAAAYVRMSSAKQDKSPAEQRRELAKLADRNGCGIVAEFLDEGISGDSGPEKRPGFRAMLEAAERGEFTTLLLWNQDRLGRFDSLEGAQYFSRLRKAGVRILTCSEGALDLESFQGRLLLTVQQEGKHQFLRDLSRSIVRGQVHNARDGYSNGGPPRYALERVLMDAAGTVVRRLLPGETVRMPGHRVRLVPGGDTAKLDAVRFMFTRFVEADVSFRGLARELTAKGFPSPRGKGWDASNVAAILANPAYCGSARWGARAAARYYSTRGQEIVATPNGNGKRITRKPPEDAIRVDGAHEGIVSPKVFKVVQHKIALRYNCRTTPRAEYPLSGLIFCEHCGQGMYGETLRRADGRYKYHRYICRTYSKGLNKALAGCGHFIIDAADVQAWLVKALQDAFLGAGRDKLVTAQRRRLRAQTRDGKADTARLGKRLAELDAEVGRLVKAIRTTDVAELATELATVRQEREAVKAEVERVSRLATPDDIDAEAQRLADEVWHLGESLADAEPAVLRELFARLVSRIDCQWQRFTTPAGRQRCNLVGGTVHLKGGELFAGLSGSGRYAEA